MVATKGTTRARMKPRARRFFLTGVTLLTPDRRETKETDGNATTRIDSVPPPT